MWIKRDFLTIYKFLLFISTIILINGCALGAKEAKQQQKASLHLQMATSLMANGKLPEALSELTIAEQLAPSSAEIQNAIGLVLQLRGHNEQAEKRFERALKLSPEYTDVRTNLARLYIDLGRYDEALREIERVENDLTYPHPEKALTLKGMTYFKKGDFDRAEPILVRAYQTQRESCLGAYFLGRTYYEKKRLNEASQILDQAIANCKGARFEEPLFYSSLSHYGLGERMQAKARAEELLNDYPKSPFVKKARALLKILDGV